MDKLNGISSAPTIKLFWLNHNVDKHKTKIKVLVIIINISMILKKNYLKWIPLFQIAVCRFSWVRCWRAEWTPVN